MCVSSSRSHSAKLFSLTTLQKIQHSFGELNPKLVDQNGPEFAKEVLKNSKEIQNDLKMTPFETASMQAGAGMPDNGGKAIRTAMNKAKGWNMLASHNKVKAIRKETLPFGKKMQCTFYEVISLKLRIPYGIYLLSIYVAISTHV